MSSQVDSGDCGRGHLKPEVSLRKSSHFVATIGTQQQGILSKLAPREFALHGT